MIDSRSERTPRLNCRQANGRDVNVYLLGRPPPGGMQGDPEDADAPGRVLYHGQDIGLGTAWSGGLGESHTQATRPGCTMPLVPY